MQFVAHAALKRLIDHLVLLNAGFAPKGFGHDDGKVMIPVTAQIFDGHFRTRNSFPDKRFDFAGGHGHGGFPKFSNPLSDDMACPWPEVNSRRARNRRN
tara:strand:+ start:335 stop:631 length:297 start_codon:yes stop_codon:yes gene_type:complete